MGQDLSDFLIKIGDRNDRNKIQSILDNFRSTEGIIFEVTKDSTFKSYIRVKLRLNNIYFTLFLIENSRASNPRMVVSPDIWKKQKFHQSNVKKFVELFKTIMKIYNNDKCPDIMHSIARLDFKVFYEIVDLLISESKKPGAFIEQ